MKKLTVLFVLCALFMINCAHAGTSLEVVAELQGTRPGNPTVTPKGRIILSMQPLDNPELRVVELLEDGSLVPFPNRDWADGPNKGDIGFSAVIGVDTTTEGVVWVLDMGSQNAPAQLVGWDSVDDRLVKVVEIDKSALAENSFLQDFAIDTKRNKVYIADTSLGNLFGDINPAFVVVDLETGESRRVLEADPALMPPMHDVVINDSLMGVKDKNGESKAIYLGLNPISIDSDMEWVYFGTVNGDKIFRVPADGLADEKLSEKEISAKIEEYGEKRASDGFIMAADGNIYTGDVEKSAIGVYDGKEYRILAQDKKLLGWADGFAQAGDGWIYVTQNQLDLNPVLNQGQEGSTKPYHILRFKPVK